MDEQAARCQCCGTKIVDHCDDSGERIMCLWFYGADDEKRARLRQDYILTSAVPSLRED